MSIAYKPSWSEVVGTIFEVVFEFIFHVIFDIIFFYTGEFILSIVTLGKHKIQESPFNTGRNNIIYGKSVFIGFMFWLFLIIAASIVL